MRFTRTLTLPCLVFAAALVALPAEALAAKKVLRIKLDGPVREAPADDAPLAVLMSGAAPLTLLELVDEIHDATKDSSVAGIALILESPETGIAQVEEIAQALKEFRAKGKKVYCYTDAASNGSYALACAADHITLAEYSYLDIVGLNAQLSFYKGLLDKIGVQADMLHCGAYKSALEPYTRTEPSKEAAENVNWLLDGIFNRWLQMMADGRKLSVDEIKAAVDAAPLEASDAQKRKLVDAVGSFADFTQMIHKEFGKDVEVVKDLDADEELELDMDTANPFAMFQQMNKVFEKLMGAVQEEEKPGIGLVYVDGPINMGKSQTSPFGGSVVGSTSVRAALDAALEDDNVKAVVLRVDSPGGSAVASDIIWKAASRLAKVKPLVVSMGGVAGSGGYYVSIPGDTIFADETTITGSIGVVGGKMVWKGLMEEKLGITTTEFPRGAHAGLMSANRPWTEGERTYMAAFMNKIYEQFKGRVTSCRGERIKGNLEELAGGRVYTGRQALEHGLIDKIGTLHDAIRFAADKVSMKDYEVHTFPKKKDFMEVLKQLMGEETADEYEIASGAEPSASWGGLKSCRSAASSDPLLSAAAPLLAGLAPQQAREIVQALQILSALNSERVGCIMPLDLRIR